MHAASREALEQLTTTLDRGLSESTEVVGVGSLVGSQLFEIVDVLDTDRTLRVALIDQAVAAEQRVALAKDLFGAKVAPSTSENIASAVSLNWSNTRDFRAGLVALGRRALLRAAEAQGQLDRVEDELFRLARVIEREPQLEMLLADRSASVDARRDLLAKILYGKVTSVTEALALQAVGRLQQRPVETLDALCDEVAALKGAEVARVTSAAALGEQQRSVLTEKLEKIYGKKISVHTEVDSSLLGGAVIRVGDEIIDGSTAGKLQRLRRNLA